MHRAPGSCICSWTGCAVGGDRARRSPGPRADPAADGRQAAAAVGQAQGQVEPLQDAAENQPGDGKRGFHRVAHELGQVEVALTVSVRDAAWVQEDEGATLRQQLPQLFVHRIIQITPGTAAADRDSRHTQLVQAAPGLRGNSRPAERNRAEGDEPALAVGHVGSEFLVAAGDYVPDQPAVVSGGAEQERRHGDGVMADTDVVHLGQPLVRLGRDHGQGRDLAARGEQRRSVFAGFILVGLAVEDRDG